MNLKFDQDHRHWYKEKQQQRQTTTHTHVTHKARLLSCKAERCHLHINVKNKRTETTTTYQRSGAEPGNVQVQGCFTPMQEWATHSVRPCPMQERATHSVRPCPMQERATQTVRPCPMQERATQTLSDRVSPCHTDSEHDRITACWQNTTGGSTFRARLQHWHLESCSHEHCTGEMWSSMQVRIAQKFKDLPVHNYVSHRTRDRIYPKSRVKKLNKIKVKNGQNVTKKQS